MDFKWVILSAVGMFLLNTFKEHVNGIFSKIWNTFIYTATIYKTDPLYLIFEEWLYKNHETKYKNTVFEAYQKEGTRNVILRVMQNKDFLVIKHKGKNLYLNKGKEKIDSAKDSFSRFDEHIEIRGFRKKELILDFINTILKEYNDNINTDSVKIFVYNKSGWFEEFDKRKVKKLDKIILDKTLKDDIITDLDLFEARKDWYLNNSLMYKRNYLFHGPPGTGKTSLAFAIASKLKKDVFILNLHQCTDLSSVLNRIQSSVVLLIEDIDVFFEQRINDNSATKIDFSMLINFFDGAYSKEGLITITTTNHLKKLDPALIRPGRMDFLREIPNAKTLEINEYLTMFYEKPIMLNEKLQLPISKIQEIAMTYSDHKTAISKILDLKKEKNEKAEI